MSFGDVRLWIFIHLITIVIFAHNESDKIEQILEWKRNQLDRMDFPGFSSRKL